MDHNDLKSVLDLLSPEDKQSVMRSLEKENMIFQSNGEIVFQAHREIFSKILNAASEEGAILEFKKIPQYSKKEVDRDCIQMLLIYDSVTKLIKTKNVFDSNVQTVVASIRQHTPNLLAVLNHDIQKLFESQGNHSLSGLPERLEETLSVLEAQLAAKVVEDTTRQLG